MGELSWPGAFAAVLFVVTSGTSATLLLRYFNRGKVRAETTSVEVQSLRDVLDEFRTERDYWRAERVELVSERDALRAERRELRSETEALRDEHSGMRVRLHALEQHDREALFRVGEHKNWDDSTYAAILAYIPDYPPPPVPTVKWLPLDSGVPGVPGLLRSVEDVGDDDEPDEEEPA